MKFFDFLTQDDFGKEIFLNLLQYKRFCLFQLMLDFNQYTGSSGVIMSIGHSSVLGISFHLLNFGFSFDFLTWKARQLDYWRYGLDYFLKNELGEISPEETHI